LNQLLDAGGANQAHPLAGLAEALGELIQTYEKRQAPLPEAEPREVLRYLVAEHGLRQTDFAGIASQGTISDILSGRRAISKAAGEEAGGQVPRIRRGFSLRYWSYETSSTK